MTKEQLLEEICEMTYEYVDYDRGRSECEPPKGYLRHAVEKGTITVSEIVRHFENALREAIGQ